MANLFRCGGKNIKTQTKTRSKTYELNYDNFSITFEQLTEVIGLSYFGETNAGGGIASMTINGNVVTFVCRNYPAGTSNTYTFTAKGY